MIYGITAQTGGGKSYMAMRKVEEWLATRPNGMVVTNLALDLGELCDHLTKEYGDTLGAAERVRLLDLDEVGKFWRHFGVGYDVPENARIEIRGGDGKKVEQIDYKCRYEAGHSVLYILDEADEIFSAKAFAAIVHDLKYYTRHQRKFGDDVYFLTPAWEFLVKELRVMCHAVWVMENGAQMKMGKIPVVGSMVRGVSWIKGTQWRVKQGGAWGGLNEVPRDVTRFRIDPKGLGRCYRTEDGLGVRGMGETVRKAEKAKGISPWWIAVAVVAVIAGFVMLPRVAGQALAKTVTDLSTVEKGSNAVHVPQVSQQPQVAVAKIPAAAPVPVPEKIREQPKEEVFLTGIMRNPVAEGCIVYLSDGRAVSDQNPGVVKLLDHSGRVGAVQIHKETFRFKPYDAGK